MLQIFELLLERQFGFTVDAVAEGDRHFSYAARGDVHFGDQFKPDFVADGIEGVGSAKGLAAQAEKAGHWILHHADQWLGQGGCAGGVEPAEARPIFGLTAGDITRTNDEIGLAARELFDQRGERFGWMAQIGIHHDDVVKLRQFHAREHGGGKPAVGGADQIPKLRITN